MRKRNLFIFLISFFLIVLIIYVIASHSSNIQVIRDHAEGVQNTPTMGTSNNDPTPTNDIPFKFGSSCIAGFGECIYLNGTSAGDGYHFLVNANSGNYDFGRKNYTIEGRIRSNNFKNNAQAIIVFDNGAAERLILGVNYGGSTNWSLELRNQMDGVLNGTIVAGRLSGDAINDSNWHHWAIMVYNASNGTTGITKNYIKLCLDGTRAGQKILNNTNFESMGQLRIGSTLSTQLKHLNASIDEIRISNISRYQGSSQFSCPTIPITPFIPDIYTEALWHFGLSPAKPLFYNNRSNATLVRNGSRVIHNINWTMNASMIGFDLITFETNITGSAKNFTNLTNVHARKYNITNTTVKKGRYYWKYYGLTRDVVANSTNRIFVLVDNVRPLVNVSSIQTNTLTPTVNINLTDNLGLSHCWYNVTVQATPKLCALPSCPVFYNCKADPTISSLSDGNSYRIWFSANDTSRNINTTHTLENYLNWTVGIASGGGETSGGGGGGGLPSTPLTCNTKDNKTLYSITTSTGTGSYVIRALPGTTVKRSLIFQNTGAGEISINLKCDGTECTNVNLDNSTIILDPNIESIKTSKFTYKIPETSKFGEELTFSIIATDSQNICALPLGVKVIVSRLSISSLVEKFTDSKTFFGFAVPNFITFLVGFVIIGLAGYIFSKFIKIKGAFAVAFISGLIGAIIIMIIL